MLSEHDYECATCGVMASEHISITSMCKVLRAVTNRESALIVANRELQDEVNEQCLLLGKSSERECVLRGRLEQLQRKRDVDHAIATRLAEALRSIKNELGVPQPEYPAPVANAVKIAEQALSAMEGGSDE
jgi:hypothetical protein